MKSQFLYLSRADVESVGLGPLEIVSAVAAALEEKGRGRAEMPPKPGIHPSGDNFLHAMPAYLPRLEAAGIKWIAAYPDNKKRGLPYISGILVLNDPETGLPLAIMDAAWITAMRTAAATAVAARLLARPQSATLAILGCGVQARSHAVILREDRPALREIVAYDHRDENAIAFREEMSAAGGLPIRIAGSAEEAVRDADLLVTAGAILKSPRPVVALDWLRPGAFVCTLDFDSSVRPETFAGADKLASDDLPQFLYYRSLGYFRGVPDPYADLGEIATGAKPGRENEDERIVCANLGLAVEDMAVARTIFDRARERKIGAALPL